ncbi:hypothetical protein DUZ99_17250 [Xylanibacillus composti]|uniref:OmpR/PhoB-type domain-containing protein n=1 Tax=Xylanibacillus composti TaxID=1572762 RepID=A0A8J4H4G5_9BACL|nr:winged helix-turn-helix domain-containing protein [Xylanibacillus composti]MDT9726726.1 hypothetical protein [Xylanibacillus composti]GIQ69342.1 hypothetical protein XYCOK13_21660 [Xylanibacillus composti]
MNEQASGKERTWVAVVDKSQDKGAVVPNRLPLPLQRVHVYGLKDVLLLCRQGCPVGWVVWQMRSVSDYDRECCTELARSYPDIPIFGLLHEAVTEEDCHDLEQLENLCLLVQQESIWFTVQHLAAAHAWPPDRDILLQPGIVYKPGQRSVQLHDRQVALTEKEQAVLDYLWTRRGQYVPTEELIAAVWDEYTASDAVRQYIYRLRKKLDAPDLMQSLITHVPGSGYRLSAAPHESCGGT